MATKKCPRKVRKTRPDSSSVRLKSTQQGDLERARQLAERAVRLDRDANTLDTLGWVHLKRGERKDAKRLFAEALEIDPDAAGAREHLRMASEPTG